tara:strand:+ start:773 stop:937 length:165 start_codon:yes stop_codon:yes gene_type:complete
VRVGNLIKINPYLLGDGIRIGVVMKKREFFVLIYWMGRKRFEWEAIVNIDEVLG